LYPNTKIIVTRKKVEGTLLTYTNELEVEIDFSDVDPSLLENMPEKDLVESKISVSQVSESGTADNFTLSPEDKSKSTISGKASRFFRK